MPKGRKGSPFTGEGVWKGRATSGMFHGEIKRRDEELRGIMVVKERERVLYLSLCRLPGIILMYCRQAKPGRLRDKNKAATNQNAYPHGL